MKTMFILFTLVCVAFQLMANSSSTQEIKGRVVDKITGAPLQGVTISISDPDTSIGTISDENGEFRLWDIPVNRKLKFSMDGYKMVSLDPASGLISNDSPFVVELENRAETKKKLSVGNLLKGRKVNTNMILLSEE